MSLRFKKWIYRWFVIPFIMDDFISKPQLQRRLEVLTRYLAMQIHKNENDRDYLIKERDKLMSIWDNYSTLHKKHREKWIFQKMKNKFN